MRLLRARSIVVALLGAALSLWLGSSAALARQAVVEEPTAAAGTDADRDAEPVDPRSVPLEALRAICVEKVAAEAEAFKLELAEYSRQLSNNPPNSVAVRATLDTIVKRGQIAVDFLLGALQDDVANLSANAALALIRLREANALGTRTEHLYTSLRDIISAQGPARGRAVDVFVRLDVSEEYKQRLGGDLLTFIPRETSDGVLKKMIDSVARLEYAPAAPVLTKLVDDPRFSIRSATVRALGRVGDTKDIPVIAKALDDESHEVRGAGYSALAAIGSRPAAAVIHPRITELATEITSTSPVNDPKVEEAKWALSALGRIQAPSSISVLKPLLTNENWEFGKSVNYTILQILDAIIADPTQAQGVTPDLLGLVQGESTKFQIVEKAFDAIVALKNADALETLHELLSHSKQNIAILSARALGDIGDRKSIAELKARYRQVSNNRNSSATLRYWIAHSLARLGDYSSAHMRELTSGYEKALSKDGNDLDALLKLGRLLMDINQHKTARKYLSRAVRLQRNPRAKGETTFDIAICYAFGGEFSKADAKIAEARKYSFQVSSNTLDAPRAKALAKHPEQAQRDYYQGLRQRFLAPTGSQKQPGTGKSDKRERNKNRRSGRD